LPNNHDWKKFSLASQFQVNANSASLLKKVLYTYFMSLLHTEPIIIYPWIQLKQQIHIHQYLQWCTKNEQETAWLFQSLIQGQWDPTSRHSWSMIEVALQSNTTRSMRWQCCQLVIKCFLSGNFITNSSFDNYCRLLGTWCIDFSVTVLDTKQANKHFFTCIYGWKHLISNTVILVFWASKLIMTNAHKTSFAAKPWWYSSVDCIVAWFSWYIQTV